ncbi:MAG: MFS transporter, partial [Alphaproteobacteria bacterium]|nr:MFS transporter [Alphaproteobacteria bacterium]
PLMLLGAPLIPLALGLMFAPPHGLSIPALTAWLAVTCVSARMAVSLFNVPYFALGAEMSEDYVERSRVVAWRAIMGIFAGLAVNLAAYGVFFVGKAGLQRASAYPGFGWAAGILVGVMALVCAVGMMRYAARLPQPAPRPGASIARLPLDALEIWRNPSFRCLFASAVIFYVAVGLNGTFGAHTAVFVWRLPTAQIQLLPYSFLAGLLVGATAAPAVSTRLEKKTMVQLGLVTVILIWLVMPILRILHIYMPTGAAATPPLMANMVFVGVGMGLASVAYPSMMADAADEHELREGVRREGLYFAGLAFAGKAAAGLGILMAGFALDIIGFPHVTGGLAPSAISEPTLQRLLLASGPTAALLCAIAMVVFAPYAISRARHAQIAQALTERRQHGRGA